MNANAMRSTLALVATTVLALLAGAAVAQAAPVKLVPEGQFAAGFENSAGVAVNNDSSSAEFGDVYEFDTSNRRVEVFSSAGVFVESFGKEVNETTLGNVCKSGEKCGGGIGGPEAGQFFAPFGIAVDPVSGNVYVDELVVANEEVGRRVQEFTAEGQFVLEIGREVNVTHDAEATATIAQKNLCTAVEMAKGTVCGAPKAVPLESTEESAFNFKQAPNVIAVGGPKDRLLVGDERRVEVFDAVTGAWVGEIPLTSISASAESTVSAFALDQTTGHIYVDYPAGSTVHEFNAENPSEGELASFTAKPRVLGRQMFVAGMALDATGHLAVTASENGQAVGVLYDPASGRRITGFAVPAAINGIAFDASENLYLDEGFNFEGNGEILFSTPKPIAELKLTTVPESSGSECKEGPETNTLVPIVCPLSGEVNTEGIAETGAFFEYGRTPTLGGKTPVELIAATGPAQVSVDLRPNETYYYQLAGFDANVEPPEEPFTTETEAFTTKLVAPRIAATETLDVGITSAQLFAELNPENAHTEYFFEYGQGEALANCPGLRNKSCPGVLATPVTLSSVYGKIGAEAEISGLQPSTTYHYRLFAENESRESPGRKAGEESFQEIGRPETFTTRPTPQPSAQTGGHSTLTATGATISGTVNPNDLPAGYAFELGVYNGEDTQYTIVASGSAGSGGEPVTEELTLTGLQPGTTYAYRIIVTSSSINNESHSLEGGIATFTTEGIPVALAPPPALTMLPTPAISFPKPEPPKKKCKRGFVRNKHGICLRSKPRKHSKHHSHKSHRGKR